MTLPDDFREFLQCLNARNVRYLVVDGHAVSFHRYPRFTHDVDVIANKRAVGRPEDLADIARLGDA